MKELELTTMSYTEANVGGLRDLLCEFEQQHNVRVQITLLNWETAWAEVMKYALYGHGPAISEVGDTWIQSLITMNALRAFEPNEVVALGGPTAFLPSAWHSGLTPDSKVWAIPWNADTRAIFYRRDMLQAAGIDERTAFLTQAQLLQTLERLQETGVRSPLVLTTQLTLNTFHYIASWVWGAGGDFVTEQFQKVVFNEEAARAGMRAFYELHRYLSPEARDLSNTECEAFYLEGKAAVTLCGPWLLSGEISPAPEVAANTGVALMPGTPFLGGSHWIAWANAHPSQYPLAGDLIRFLTTKEATIRSSQQVGLLPARLDALNSPPFTEDPIYKVLSQGVKAGRTFPAVHLWGMVEDKLSAALGRIWAKVVQGSTDDIDSLIEAELNPLAQRLNWVLSSDMTKRN